ncbi:hypothetical protein D030_1269B, partial [Vibrio parahaemolyticus AQ3810]
LNHFAFVHYHHFVGDVFYDTDMLRHVHKRQAHLFLQLQEQVDDLRAHRHIQTV